MSSINTHVGKMIRKYRKAANLTLQQLADAIHKSRATICKYENGDISMDIETLYEISQVLQVSVPQLTDIGRLQAEADHSSAYALQIWRLLIWNLRRVEFYSQFCIHILAFFSFFSCFSTNYCIIVVEKRQFNQQLKIYFFVFMISSSNFHCYSYCLCCIYFMSCPTNEHYKYLATKIKLVARYKIVQRQKIIQPWWCENKSLWRRLFSHHHGILFYI